MDQGSGLIHKRHRRGKKRRDKLRLALRIALSLVALGIAAALSVGIIHVVERPVPPFKSMAERPDPEASAMAPETPAETPVVELGPRS